MVILAYWNKNFEKMTRVVSHTSHCVSFNKHPKGNVVDRLNCMNRKLNKKLLSSRWLKDKGDNFLFDWRLDFFWTACRKVFYLITVWDSLEPGSCDISDSFEYNIGVKIPAETVGIMLSHFIRSHQDTLSEIGSTMRGGGASLDEDRERMHAILKLDINSGYRAA